MSRYFSLLLTLPLFLFTACNKDRITGSGSNQTEIRTVSPFTKVETNGSIPVYITQGSSFEVKVTAYANLIPYLKTNVSDGTLKIGYDKNIRNDNAVAYITMPQLKGLRSNGSGNMSVTGPFMTDELVVSISGSAEINIDTATVEDYDVEISGSGKVKGYGVGSRNADVHISGSGEVWLTASETLEADISGSGVVYYKGDPTVDTRISGSGKVIKK